MRTYRWSLWPMTYVHEQQGLALVMALMFIAILTLVGSTAVTINSTDLLLGAAFQASQTAFHNADSGVNYVAAQIPALVTHDQLKLDGTTITEAYIFKHPSDFEFHIARQSTFKRIANTRKYLLEVTGYPRPHSPIKSTMEVVLQRRTALGYGLFAADRLDLPAQGRIYSYDSRQLSHGRRPTTSTSTVKIAANGRVTAQARHLDLDIDGDITLGETPGGEAASFAFREASPDVPPPPVMIMTGGKHPINLMPGDALPTDPLHIEEMVAAAQKHLQLKNDNDRQRGLGDYRLTHSRYLREGSYYLKELTLGAGQFLILDARRADINIYADAITFAGNATFDVVTDHGVGNVNIYLGGAASFGSQSASTQPRLNVTGDATTFRLFSRSSEPINFYHEGDLKGFIYAPYAPVMVRNSNATGYGILWSHTLDFSMHDTPYTFYTDTALQEMFLSEQVDMVSWKELRD